MRRIRLILAGIFIACGVLRAAPATQPAVLDKQIAGLIAQLDSPDAAMREKATAKLINIGPRVLKPLRDALTARGLKPKTVAGTLSLLG